MIIVRLTSGMGNQMYQYAFYRLMQKRYPNTEVKLDLTWFYANDDHHGYELERAFNIHADTASYSQLFGVSGLLPNMCKKGGSAGRRFEAFRRYPNRVIREFTQAKRAPYIIDQLDGDIPNDETLYDKLMNLDVTKDWYIKGFFIEEKYYSQVIDKMREEYSFRDFDDSANLELAERIKSQESVSLHVRRGDYLTTYKDLFAPLTEEYYKRAVDAICERVENPQFFIFSDDSDFATKEFRWLKNNTVVNINHGSNSFRDMQLMSLCHHSIIANSTFSQWGALLNPSDLHITVYPAAYLIGQDNEEKSLPGWVRI